MLRTMPICFPIGKTAHFRFSAPREIGILHAMP
jgi:hypothetical protein